MQRDKIPASSNLSIHGMTRDATKSIVNHWGMWAGAHNHEGVWAGAASLCKHSVESHSQ